jgi:aminoglycoside phosphotransferase family enzyme/predicted kinase
VDAIAPVPVSEVVDWLAGGAGEGPPAERVVETSIAWVFLYGDRVLKLKKAVDFGFLDFSTVEQRRWACERELAFNRETAPDLYRRVIAVTRRSGGGLRLGGEGEAVDWVVEMRRFDDQALLSRHPEAIDAGLAESLGREIARFHAAARLGPQEAGRTSLDYVLKSNAGLLRRKAEVLGEAAVEALLAATQAEFDRLSERLESRGRAGFVRRCHGDLHLGNIMVEHGRPVLFDCLEFNDTLSEIDVLYDLGFLLMDLEFRGAGAAANRTLNGWLDEAARGLPEEGFWSGLEALPLFQSVRAAVRAHVTVNQHEAEAARLYLQAAQRHLAPPPPRLVAVGGYSGSGKSTYARRVAPGLGAAPGAVVLRSDEIRKRLWDRGPLEKLPAEAYAAGQSERVYGAMLHAGGSLLRAGRAVVLDAAFLRPEERAAAQALAQAAGVPFEGIWLDAAPEALRARVASRTGDASDADLAVLERQLGFDTGPIGWRREAS